MSNWEWDEIKKIGGIIMSISGVGSIGSGSQAVITFQKKKKR